jgi:hypothetical protein
MKQGKKKSSGRRPPETAPPAKATAPPATQEAPRFAISAKDAAAIIKADVEAHNAATGGDPDGLLRGGFGWRET